MESVLECTERPCYYRDPKSPCIVRTSGEFTRFIPNIASSVSSVKTLEDAKVAPGCFYMQMPVQEVGLLSFLVFVRKAHHHE